MLTKFHQGTLFKRETFNVKTLRRVLNRCVKLVEELEENYSHEIELSLMETIIETLEGIGSEDDATSVLGSVKLWLTLHKLVKHREEALITNIESLTDYYAKSERLGKEVLPTPSLTILMNGHEALGRTQKCKRKEVKLVILYNYKTNGSKSLGHNFENIFE